MNKYLRLALFRRRDPVPVIEHGERLWAREDAYRPFALEPPRVEPRQSLTLIMAGLAMLLVLAGFLLIVIFAIGGFPKCSKAADLGIEAGPGQDGAAMALASVRERVNPWLSLDPHLAAIRREGKTESCSTLRSWRHT